MARPASAQVDADIRRLLAQRAANAQARNPEATATDAKTTAVEGGIEGVYDDTAPPESLPSAVYQALRPQTFGVGDEQQATEEGLRQIAKPVVGDTLAERFVPAVAEVGSGIKRAATGFVSASAPVLAYRSSRNVYDAYQKDGLTGALKAAPTAGLRALGETAADVPAAAGEVFGGVAQGADAGPTLIYGRKGKNIQAEGPVAHALRIAGTVGSVPITELVGWAAEAAGLATPEQRQRSWRNQGSNPASAFGYDMAEGLKRGDGFMTLANAVSRTQGYQEGDPAYRALQLGGFAADALLPTDMLTIGALGKGVKGSIHSADLARHGVPKAVAAGVVFGHMFPDYISRTSVSDVGDAMRPHANGRFSDSIEQSIAKHMEDPTVDRSEAVARAFRDTARAALGSDQLVHVTGVGTFAAKDMKKIQRAQEATFAPFGGRAPEIGTPYDVPTMQKVLASLRVDPATVPDLPGGVVTPQIRERLVNASLEHQTAFASQNLQRYSPTHEAILRGLEHPAVPRFIREKMKGLMATLPSAAYMPSEVAGPIERLNREVAQEPQSIVDEYIAAQRQNKMRGDEQAPAHEVLTSLIDPETLRRMEAAERSLSGSPTWKDEVRRRLDEQQATEKRNRARREVFDGDIRKVEIEKQKVAKKIAQSEEALNVLKREYADEVAGVRSPRKASQEVKPETAEVHQAVGRYLWENRNNRARTKRADVLKAMVDKGIPKPQVEQAIGAFRAAHDYDPKTGRVEALRPGLAQTDIAAGSRGWNKHVRHAAAVMDALRGGALPTHLASTLDPAAARAKLAELGGDHGQFSQWLNRQVQDALAAGRPVTLVTNDYGRIKRTPIVAVDERGNIRRADGLPQGNMGLLTGNAKVGGDSIEFGASPSGTGAGGSPDLTPKDNIQVLMHRANEHFLKIREHAAEIRKHDEAMADLRDARDALPTEQSHAEAIRGLHNDLSSLVRETREPKTVAEMQGILAKLADHVVGDLPVEDVGRALDQIREAVDEADNDTMALATDIQRAYGFVPTAPKMTIEWAKEIIEAFAAARHDGGAKLKTVFAAKGIEALPFAEGTIRFLVNERINKRVADAVHNMAVSHGLDPSENPQLVDKINEILAGRVQVSRERGKVLAPPDPLTQMAAQYIDRWGLPRLYDKLVPFHGMMIPASVEAGIKDAISRGQVPQFGYRKLGTRGENLSMYAGRFRSFYKETLLLGPLSPVGAVRYVVPQVLSAVFSAHAKLGTVGTARVLSRWLTHPEFMAAAMTGEGSLPKMFGGKRSGQNLAVKDAFQRIHTPKMMGDAAASRSIESGYVRTEAADGLINLVQKDLEGKMPWMRDAINASRQALQGKRSAKATIEGLIQHVPGAYRAWVDFLWKGAQEVDRTMRMTVFVDQVLQGKSYDQAAEVSRAALLDFGKMTKWERETLGKAFLFYSFTRANFDSYIHSIAEDPSRVGRQARFLRELPEAVSGDDDTTRYMRDSDMGRLYLGESATKGPKGERFAYGTSPMPLTSFLGILSDILGTAQSGANLLRADPEMGGGIDVVPQDAQGTLGDIVGAMGPEVQAAYEAKTGESAGGFQVTETSADNEVPGWLIWLGQLAGSDLFNHLEANYLQKRPANPKRQWMGDEVTYTANNEALWRNMQRFLGLSSSFRDNDRLAHGLIPGTTGVALRSRDEAVNEASRDVSRKAKESAKTLKKRAKAEKEVVRMEKTGVTVGTEGVR